jgi:hypothetical protein
LPDGTRGAQSGTMVAMDKNDFSSLVAAILPVLLGMGLIELYISREISIAVIGAGLFALAMIMVVIAALSDVAAMRRPRRRRSRSGR